MNNNHSYAIVILTIVATTLVALTFFVGAKKFAASQTETLEAALVYPNQELKDHIEFEIPAESVLVVSADLDQIVYAKNIYQTRPIASITKLMTAMIVLDNYNLAQTITLSTTSVSYLDKNTFQGGEKIKVFDLLTALLIESSNEAAYALAEQWPHYDGPTFIKQEKFVEAMNEKAKELGMLKTIFSNPSGLDDGINASSAWDVALLARSAMHYPIIRDITVQPRATIYSEQGIAHALESTNKLLGVLQGIKFGKTGSTDEAGQSLTLAVEKDDIPLIVVLLNAKDRFLNASELLENIKL